MIDELKIKISISAKKYLDYEISNCDEVHQEILLDEVITHEVAF